MARSSQLIAVMWLGFVVFWTVSAFSAKPSLDQRARWRTRLGLILLLLIAFALRSPLLRRDLAQASSVDLGQAAHVAGVVLCALGLGFAIWARIHIGRNWGLPMSRKREPELVTSGPYAFVRHPIYSGVILAMLGSALGGSLGWLPAIVICAASFFYSARAEERILLEEFPQSYAAYRRRTKMMIPFVL